MQVNLTKGNLKAVTDSHGAELISFQDENGKEYIWCGDPAYWAGRNPNLFPIVGNLKDGKVKFDGKEYEMGRHGFARNSEFQVAERGEDYVVFELKDSEETWKHYPYHFSFQVEHRLTENGFKTSYIVTNTGNTDLPYCVGAHTAINCPLEDGEKFEDYRLVFDETEDAPTLLLTPQGLIHEGHTEPMLCDTDTLMLKYDVYARLDTVIFRGLKSKGVSLRHKETGHGVHMDIGQFPMVAFWTKGAERAPYICLEPWHGCAASHNESGDFLEKPHVIILKPGERKTLEYAISTI